MYHHIYPGTDPSAHGTTLYALWDGMDWAAAQCGASYPQKVAVNAANLMDCLSQGMYVIVAEYNLLHLGESHFLLFLPGRGDTPEAIHCLDSDQQIDGDPDVWSVAQVIDAAEALLGQGASFGIGFTIQ